jgi:hypothetical protein
MDLDEYERRINMCLTHVFTFNKAVKVCLIHTHIRSTDMKVYTTHWRVELCVTHSFCNPKVLKVSIIIRVKTSNHPIEYMDWKQGPKFNVCIQRQELRWQN